MDKILFYVCEVLITITAIIGNGLVLIVFHKEKRLRKRTNYYIASLAFADFLVGFLNVPCTLLVDINFQKQQNLCLLMLTLLLIFRVIFIFNLFALFVDRYWTVIQPMGCSKFIRPTATKGTIYGCWVAGTIVGVLPLVSWNSPKLKENEWEWEICMFVQVVNHNFIKFIYVTTIIVPSIFIATAFIHIYFVSLKQIKNQIPEKSTTESNNAMQELFNSARKQDIKSTKILGLMVIIFMISWIPINTFNIIIIIKPHLKPPIILNNLFITISHLNSVINPVLYIYQFNNFKDALKSVLNSSKESQKKNNRDNIAHIYNSSNPIYMLKDKNMIQMLSLKVFESKSNSPDSSIASNLSTYISTHLENDEDKSVHQNNVESAKNNNEIKS